MQIPRARSAVGDRRREKTRWFVAEGRTPAVLGTALGFVAGANQREEARAVAFWFVRSLLQQPFAMRSGGDDRLQFIAVKASQPCSLTAGRKRGRDALGPGEKQSSVPSSGGFAH